MLNYNYKPNYLNGKALSQHSISSLNNTNTKSACIHLNPISLDNNCKTNRSVSYNLNNSNLSLNQQKLFLSANTSHSYFHHNPMMMHASSSSSSGAQILNSKSSVVNRANSFRNESELINPTSIDNFIFTCANPLNKFSELSLQKLNKKILSIDKYIKNNRSESSSTISLLSDLEFEIREDLTVNELDTNNANNCANSNINQITKNEATKSNSNVNNSTKTSSNETDQKCKEAAKLKLSDSKSISSIFNYRPVIEDSLETLLNAAAKKGEKQDNYDNYKYKTIEIEPYSKEKYKLSRKGGDVPCSRYSVSHESSTSGGGGGVKVGMAKSRANSKSSTSSYYNRVESSSSVDSLNKNSSGSSKNLFKKNANLSLYYDSGIGVDSPLNVNNYYSKYLRLNKFKRLNDQTNKSSHDMSSTNNNSNTNQRIKSSNLIKCNKSDYNLRKDSCVASSSTSTSTSQSPKQLSAQMKSSYCKTLNPNMGRRFYNESTNVFNVLNSSSSTSINNTIKLNDIKSAKQYSTSDLNGGGTKTCRVNLRSSSPNNFKNFFRSSLSMQADKNGSSNNNNDDDDDEAFMRKSSITVNDNLVAHYTKADFTPQLMTNSGIIKTNSIKHKSLHKANKLHANSSSKNDATVKVNKTFPVFKGHSFVNVNDQEVKSSSNLQHQSTSSTKTMDFQKHCIDTINKNLNTLSHDINGGRKLKIEVEVKRGNLSNKNKQQNNDNEEVKTVEKKVTSLNDYSTLYSKNINLKKSEKSVQLSEDNEVWHTLKNKYGSSLYEKSAGGSHKLPDKSHVDKEWFHGNLTRNQAYLVIMENQTGNGSFLVRNNSSDEGSFTLCIYKNGKIYNYKINSENEQLFITNKHKFDTLNELIEFYKKNSAGLICELKTPVIEQNLIEKCSTLSLTQTNQMKKYKIDRRDIEFFEKIGSGQFGVVLKAEYKKRKTVAVKKMKPGSKDDEINFNREAEFMMKLQNLQELQHKNLVQFFGISKDFDDSILIVTEFVKYGSLYNYLLKYKDRIVNSKSRLTRLLNVCIDVCDGMEYLESHRIIHRDLACRNCLVGEGEVIKVADFGLARFTDDYYIAHPQSQFPVKWSAPEVIKYRSYSSKSDVWSFSCLMYEVFTCGKMPYGGNTTNSIAAKQIISGIVPEKPIYCPLSLYDNVLIKAWSKEPKDRPSFKDLMQLLNNYNN